MSLNDERPFTAFENGARLSFVKGEWDDWPFSILRLELSLTDLYKRSSATSFFTDFYKISTAV